jgi:hypothetical protein
MLHSRLSDGFGINLDMNLCASYTVDALPSEAVSAVGSSDDILVRTFVLMPLT